MGLFSKKGKSSGYFFDNEDDIDPWESPTVNFFKDKSIKNSKFQNTPSLNRENLRELSFSDLNASYSKITRKLRDEGDDDVASERKAQPLRPMPHRMHDGLGLSAGPNQVAATAPHARETYPARHGNVAPQYQAHDLNAIREDANIKINPEQRLFDVYTTPPVDSYAGAQRPRGFDSPRTEPPVDSYVGAQRPRAFDSPGADYDAQFGRASPRPPAPGVPRFIHIPEPSFGQMDQAERTTTRPITRYPESEDQAGRADRPIARYPESDPSRTDTRPISMYPESAEYDQLRNMSARPMAEHPEMELYDRFVGNMPAAGAPAGRMSAKEMSGGASTRDMYADAPLGGMSPNASEHAARPSTRTPSPQKKSDTARARADAPPAPTTARQQTSTSQNADDFARMRDSRFFIKIAATGGVFIGCGLMLWWIGQQDKPSLRDNIVVIPSPRDIKVRGNPDAHLVPYQDELIYGKIDNSEDAQGEHLLAPGEFAPEIKVDDADAGGAADEYLDDPAAFAGRDMEEHGGVPQVGHVQQVGHSNVAYNNPYPKAGVSAAVASTHAPSQIGSHAPSQIGQHTPSHIAAHTPSQIGSHASSQVAVHAPLQVAPRTPSQVGSRTPSQVAPQTPAPKKAGVSILPKKASVPPPPAAPIYVQIATLPSIEMATKEVARLAGRYTILAKHQITVRPYSSSNGTVYRLLIGPLSSEQEANAITKTLHLR
ncbi:MAG: SPOR domain-containing protein [Holosporales bacterium]|jgi:hypothetical protein|nr:SPOR domain-containing protein [Holosporales bacterium]